MPSRARDAHAAWLGVLLGLCLAAPLAAADVGEAAGEWRRMAPLPEARTEVSVATDGARLFLAGGFKRAGEEEATAPRRLFAYDPGDDRWETLTELPQGVNHAGFEYHDGRLYLIGGYDEASFTPTDAFHIYDIDAERWRQGPVLPTPRGALATAWMRRRWVGPSTSSPAAPRPASPFPTSTSG